MSFRAATQEEVRPFELHSRGNPARQPVVNPLDAALFVVPEERRDFRGSAEVVDELCVRHGIEIKHDVYESVNATFINKLFSRPTIGRMHDSVLRLLKGARASTKQPKMTLGEVAAAMGVSAQRANNWTRRGISNEGAIAAEKTFGCSAHWVLTGEEKQTSAAVTAREPDPSPYGPVVDLSETDWAMLEVFQAFPPSRRQKIIEKLQEESAEFREMADEAIKKLTTSGTVSPIAPNIEAKPSGPAAKQVRRSFNMAGSASRPSKRKGGGE